jgi:plasmid stabilization system protein ParE
MQLRWTEEAAADLERIADYLFDHAPERARKLVRAIYEAPGLLKFPIGAVSARRKGRGNCCYRRSPTS